MVAGGEGMLFPSIACSHPFHCHAYENCAFVPDTLPRADLERLAGEFGTAVHVIPARHLANEIRLRREYATFSGIGARLTRESYERILAFEIALKGGPSYSSKGIGIDAPTPEEWTSGSCDFFGAEPTRTEEGGGDDDDDDDD